MKSRGSIKKECPASPEGYRHYWKFKWGKNGVGEMRCIRPGCGVIEDPTLIETKARKRTRDRKHTLFKRDGNLCWLCDRSMSYDEATFDHVIPKCEGGPNDLSNMRLAHSWCNHARGLLQDPGYNGRKGEKGFYTEV